MVVDGGLKKLEWHYLNCLLGVQSVLKLWLFSKVFFNYENFRIAVLKIIGVLTFPSLIFTKIDFYLQLQISFRISILAALNWFGSIWWSRGCPWLHNYWVLNNPKHNIWFFMPCFKVIRVNPFLTASHHHLKNQPNPHLLVDKNGTALIALNHLQKIVAKVQQVLDRKQSAAANFSLLHKSCWEQRLESCDKRFKLTPKFSWKQSSSFKVILGLIFSVSQTRRKKIFGPCNNATHRILNVCNCNRLSLSLNLSACLSFYLPRCYTCTCTHTYSRTLTLKYSATVGSLT